jgi:hypothetical protein
VNEEDVHAAVLQLFGGDDADEDCDGEVVLSA